MLIGRELCAVVVGRIPIDCMNVIEVALLRRVLDDHRRPLDAVVGEPAILGVAAPGELGLREVGLELRHLGRRRGVVEDPDPLVRDIEQHRLLAGGQRRPLDAFGLNNLAVLPGPSTRSLTW